MNSEPREDYTHSEPNGRDALYLLESLVRIPSVNPPGQEEEIAAFVQDYLAANGFETRVVESLPGRPSVLGVFDTGISGPSLLFNGHLDVVPAGEGWTVDPFGAEVRGDKLYGRGAADMKGGLAAMLAAAVAVKRSEPVLRGKLLLLAVADEEVSSTGMRAVLEEGGINADCAIVAEPSEMQVVIAHKGVVHFIVTTHGATAHGSRPDLGANAIDGMVSLLAGVYGHRNDLAKRRHPLLGSPTLSVGTIHGGTVANIIPDLCQVKIDRRLLPGETVESALLELKQALANSPGLPPGISWDDTHENESPAMEIGENEVIVKVLKQAVESVTSTSARVAPWSATSDAGILQQAGIPSVIFGPGSLGNAHKPDEWVRLSEVVQATEIFQSVITNFLKLV